MTGTPLQWPDVFGDDGVVRLDRLERDDAPAIAASVDAEAKRWLPMPDPYTLDDAYEFLDKVDDGMRAGTRLTFAIRPTGAATLLGTVSLQLEGRPHEGAIGYAVTPAARSGGVARRATVLAARYGFDHLELQRVEILVQPGNLASRAVARACGAIYEGVRREGILFVTARQRFDAAVYALVRADMR